MKTDITILITGEGQGKGEKLYYAETCECKHVAEVGDAEVTEDEGRCLLMLAQLSTTRGTVTLQTRHG